MCVFRRCGHRQRWSCVCSNRTSASITAWGRPCCLTNPRASLENKCKSKPLHKPADRREAKQETCLNLHESNKGIFNWSLCGVLIESSPDVRKSLAWRSGDTPADPLVHDAIEAEGLQAHGTGFSDRTVSDDDDYDEDEDDVSTYVTDSVSVQLSHRLDPLHEHRQLVPVHVNHSLTQTHEQICNTSSITQNLTAMTKNINQSTQLINLFIFHFKKH